MTAIGGTAIVSLVVFCIDVVVEGCYIFSALACPIWFIVAAVRAALQRPKLSVAVARVLIPIVTLLLVIANYSMQRTIAMRNAASVIQACERYRQANGVYPEHLSELVPSYLSRIPRAKYCWERSQFEYSGASRPGLRWWECPPFGRRVYIFETGTWRYID